MNVITLRDYARQKNISYEAVRKQVVRYQDELAGHVIRDGRQQFLDEDAVAFLDAKRQKNPVAIIQQNKDEQIETLEDQVKQLLVKTAAQADKISELAQWKAENALAIAEADQTRRLLGDAQRDKQLLEGFVADAKAEIAILSDERDEAKAMARQSVEAAQKAAEELVAAQEKATAEKTEKEAWKRYAAELAAYNALGWLKRRKAIPPTPPIEQEN